MKSSASSQPNQPYSSVNCINLDMDFEQLMFSQEYNYSQDYSMGHGSAHGSAHGSVPVNDDEEGDSPVEEVSPVKPKKPSRRTTRAKKDDHKEPPKDWTVAKETALCQAWCDVSENNTADNSMKTKGVRPRVSDFCVIINNVEENHKSSTNDLDVYHKACAEYKMMYTQDFTLEHCYNVLKDRPAGEAVKETQQLRPMGRDRSKAKKKSVGSSRVGSFSFVDLVADKLLNMKRKKWGKRDEQQQSYIKLKYWELSIREAGVREAAQLKRERLEIQRRMLELAEGEKRDRDHLIL
nr:hypothetical protein [Tanacetum cinerariifolium]